MIRDDGPIRDGWYAADFETTTDLDSAPVEWIMGAEERAAHDDLKPGDRRTRVMAAKGDDVRTVTYRRDDSGELIATTRTGRVRVWSWAIAEVGSTRIWTGRDIAGFVEKAAELGGIYYFHNLRFDGAFLDAYLQDPEHGLGLYPGVWRPVQVPQGAFGALISDSGAHYARYVHLRDGRRFEVRDSLKKFPATTIAALAGMFNAPAPKGEIDYDVERPVGYMPTPEEWQYLETDVEILRTALLAARNAGATGLTIGGDALREYRATMAHGKFRTVFPLLERDTDDFIRRAYRGGWTFVPEWVRAHGPFHELGSVYDVNSMYPAVMRESAYPVGIPVWLAPGQTELAGYPHRIVGAMFDATLKPGRLPMIQVKRDSRYNPVQYQSEVRAVEWYGTEIDWKLLHEQYDVTVHEWTGGMAFRSETGLFNRYIDKWMDVKMNAKGGARTQSKFQLNNLWGRFAINPLRAGRLPGLSPEGVPTYELLPQEYDEPCYTAVGVWTTSYGRDRVIRAAQSFGDRFLAADTDSVHILGTDPLGLDVHETRLGAWKREAVFESATYLRAKAYAEQIDGEVEAHVAGLPRKLLGGIRVEDLQIGARFSGKLIPKRVPGGIILESTDFVIGERDAWGHNA